MICREQIEAELALLEWRMGTKLLIVTQGIPFGDIPDAGNRWVASINTIDGTEVHSVEGPTFTASVELLQEWLKTEICT